MVDTPPFFASAGREELPLEDSTNDDLNDYIKGEVQRVSPTTFWGEDEAPTVWIGEGLLPRRNSQQGIHGS